MKNQIIHLSLLSVVCFVGQLSYARQGPLTEAEILARYQTAVENSLLHREKSAFRAEQKSTETGALYGPRPYETVCEYTVFHDGGRLDIRKKQTQFFQDDQNIWGTSRVDHEFQYLLNRNHTFFYNTRAHEDPSYVIAFTKGPWTRGLGSLGIVGMALEGYDDQGKRISEILQDELSALHLRDSMQVVDDHETYVLEADTQYGHYTLWIDPNCGFNARRIVIHRTSDDLMNGKPVSSPPPKLPRGAKPGRPLVPLSEYLLTLDSVKIEDIDGIFLPVEGVINITRTYSNGEKIIWAKTYKRLDIDLDPDFAATPEPFVFNVANGTPVVHMDNQGIKYIWQDGNVVPADDPTFEEIDKMVEDLRNQNQ